MKKTEIKNCLNLTKKRFLENDGHLLSATANERSITHKFAEHLQNIIGCCCNVDCEYNRYGNNTKKIPDIKEVVGENVSTDEIKTRTVYPDIIVHKRGVDGPNILVIEAKKDATEDERNSDLKKLQIIQREYKYDFMVFLNFKTKKIPDIEIEFIDN